MRGYSALFIVQSVLISGYYGLQNIGVYSNEFVRNLSQPDHAVNDQAINQKLERRASPGGVTEGDPNLHVYTKLAKRSLGQFLQKFDTPYNYEVLRVNKVTKQIIEGTRLEIDFQILPTNCLLDNAAQSPSSQCLALEGTCHTKIWSRPWLNTEAVTVNCDIENEPKNQQRNRRQALGGATQEDPNAHVYTLLAKRSLDQFLQTSDTPYHYEVVRVTKVDKQIVAGTQTDIYFKVAPTNCLLNMAGLEPSSSCIQLNSYCHSKISSKPWLNTEEVTVNCNI